MKREELVQRSIKIVIDYYDNRLAPFFDAIADDVLWFGPRAGQVLEGRDAVIRTWSAEETELRFAMGNIEARSVATGPSGLEILLEYYVYTYFPNGQTDRHHQRLHYSWGYAGKGKERTPKIYMIHISNVAGDPDDDADGVRVYADSPSSSSIDSIGIPNMTRIHFRTVYGKGTDEITYFFNAGTVLWIESTDRSLHAEIHTTEGTYTAIEKLRYFEEQFGGSLLRIHTSYLVNPMYVRSIRRFAVGMTDGTVIPIPEKKYTAVKQKLLAFNSTLS